MSLNPFSADPAIAARVADRATAIGPALKEALADLLSRRQPPSGNFGSVLAAAEAADLVDRFGLGGVEELMLLGLDAARGLARPPISGFFVGAIGLERQTGNLVFGGNLEFPGTHLGTTVHGEGFVFTRAASRGTEIAVIAIGEAHPCAHCRQYLSEFAGSAGLILIDPLGHRLTLAQLYPWPFDPAYLGDPGYRPGKPEGTAPQLATIGLPAVLATRLLAAGHAAHAPYSKCPGAVVLGLADGEMVTGFSIESVAFNPTISPMQAALIDLYAHGYGPADIVAATLATRSGGPVDHRASARELLAAVAPAVTLDVVEWA